MVGKKYRVVFEFEDRELAEDFLGYMSDGGGEQGFETDEYNADFNYWISGAFGKKVLVTRVKKDV